MLSTDALDQLGIDAAIGSSSRMSLGSGISIDANWMSFCWPPDSFPAG